MANELGPGVYFDRFSLAHFAVGALFQTARVPAPLAIGSHVVFEAVENPLKELSEPIWPEAEPDSMENHVGDLVSFSAGYYATRALSYHGDAGRVVTAAVGAAAAAMWFWELTSPTRQGGWQHT